MLKALLKEELLPLLLETKNRMQMQGEASPVNAPAFALNGGASNHAPMQVVDLDRFLSECRFVRRKVLVCCFPASLRRLSGRLVFDDEDGAIRDIQGEMDGPDHHRNGLMQGLQF